MNRKKENHSSIHGFPSLHTVKPFSGCSCSLAPVLALGNVCPHFNRAESSPFTQFLPHISRWFSSEVWPQVKILRKPKVNIEHKFWKISWIWVLFYFWKCFWETGSDFWIVLILTIKWKPLLDKWDREWGFMKFLVIIEWNSPWMSHKPTKLVGYQTIRWLVQIYRVNI